MCFIQNNFTRWYLELISKAKQRGNIDAYTERHHIIPRSLGGNDDCTNIVRLTTREHFIAHLLLCRMCAKAQDHRKMLFAFQMMANAFAPNQRRYMGSRIYSLLKDKIAEAKRQENSGEKNPFFGRKHSEETKRKLGHRGLCGDRNGMYGRRHSDEAKERMRAATKNRIPKTGSEHPFYGKSLSAEHREKLRVAMLGRTFSKETRMKISASKMGSRNPNFGKVYTPDESARMRNAQIGKKRSSAQRTHMKKQKARATQQLVRDNFGSVTRENWNEAKRTGILTRSAPKYDTALFILGEELAT